MAEYYTVKRYFQNGRTYTLKTGLSLEQAIEHCRNPETSSVTCKRTLNRQRTAMKGPWFDGYTRS